MPWGSLDKERAVDDLVVLVSRPALAKLGKGLGIANANVRVVAADPDLWVWVSPFGRRVGKIGDFVREMQRLGPGRDIEALGRAALATFDAAIDIEFIERREKLAGAALETAANSDPVAAIL